MDSRDTGAVLFLISMAVVEMMCVLGLVFFHVEKLPDPLNVVVLIVVAFGPLSLMIYYFIVRFYFPKMRYLVHDVEQNK